MVFNLKNSMMCNPYMIWDGFKPITITHSMMSTPLLVCNTITCRIGHMTHLITWQLAEAALKSAYCGAVEFHTPTSCHVITGENQLSVCWMLSFLHFSGIFVATLSMNLTPGNKHRTAINRFCFTLAPTLKLSKWWRLTANHSVGSET